MTCATDTADAAVTTETNSIQTDSPLTGRSRLPAPLAVLTTGEIALAFGSSPRMVAIWIDAGRLKGYRLPGSKDRRATLEDVLAFAAEYGLPTTHALLNESPQTETAVER